MNVDCVAVFVEATAAGSLAAAARKLGLAPMAASRRLAALEDELGVRLVHRTTRALALTVEGEAFLPYAEAMIEDAASARAAVRPSVAGVAGLLRVTASEPFGRKVVSAMLPAFLGANPDLRVDLLLTDSLVDIVAAGVDVAIRIAPLRDSSLVARRLAANPRRLYASPGYLATAGTPRRISDLDGHQCLLLSGATHWVFAVGERTRRLRVAGRYSSNSIEALHEACIRGLGVALLAEWNAADDVASGRLVPLPLDDGEPETLGIWAVYPTARLVPPKARLFVEALMIHLEQGGAQLAPGGGKSSGF